VVEVTPAEGLKLSAVGSFAAALVGEMLDYDSSARSSASGDLDNAYFVTL
jgi:hypothetical protein